MELEAERSRRQKEYMLQLTELQDEITHIRRLQKDIKDEDERRKVLQQHQQDLERLRAVPRTLPPTTEENSQPSQERSHQDTGLCKRSTNRSSLNCPADKPALPATEPWSSAAADWEYQKKFEGARSEEIDSLMNMIGLEDVKQKFLAIKSKVDTATRQNINLKDERFGTVLIGNPGTGKSASSLPFKGRWLRYGAGKTTVARIYAKFLTSVGVIPGASFVETTGSRLANNGVSGCEKQINEILNKGGGVLFIDEAYQLVPTQGVGHQVLDFLLAEVERLTGKIVIVLAGYRSHMEKFFGQNPGLPSRFLMNSNSTTMMTTSYAVFWNTTSRRSMAAE
jgi:hypothetical protein